MAFTLRVHFAGLCHFIENKEREAPVKMCVVLPKADNHNSVLQLGMGNIVDANGQEPSNLPLVRKRLTFRFKGKDAQAARLFRFGDDGLKGVLPMETIASGFADENPAIVRANPPSEVQAQVLLDRGEFGIDPSAGTTKWAIPATLRRGQKEIAIANKMFTEIEVSEDSVELIVKELGKKDKGQVYTLKPKDGYAEITVSNDCQPTASPSAIDQDFIYHYNLLSPEALAAMKRRSGGKDGLPLPVKPEALIVATPEVREMAAARYGVKLKEKPSNINTPLSAALGCNCVPSSGKARFIGLNTFILNPDSPSASRRARAK